MYYAWYEFYPAHAVFLDQGTYPVNPGDHMHAEASVSGAVVSLTLQNLTQNWTLSPNPTLSSSGLDLACVPTFADIEIDDDWLADNKLYEGESELRIRRDS